MSKPLWRRAVGAVCLVVGFAPANDALARAWILSPAESSLAFSYEEDGVTKTGVFDRFDAAAWFDPSVLDKTELALTIDMASIDGPDLLRETVARGIGWFEVADHPEASFQLASLQPIGGDRYIVSGVLTVKSISHPLSGEATVAIADGRAHVRGAFSVSREAYRLGGGLEELLFEISPDVAVRFDLVATAADG